MNKFKILSDMTFYKANIYQTEIKTNTQFGVCLKIIKVLKNETKECIKEVGIWDDSPYNIFKYDIQKAITKDNLESTDFYE